MPVRVKKRQTKRCTTTIGSDVMGFNCCDYLHLALFGKNLKTKLLVPWVTSTWVRVKAKANLRGFYLSHGIKIFTVRIRIW